MKNIRNSIAGLFLIAISITACVKGDFDEPPLIVNYVDFEANTTIAQLKDWDKANRVTGTNYILIEENIIISGVVVANDESGNLFKKIVIQDETSGIELSLDQYNLYTGYKLGQRIFVKCENMYIGAYNGLVQLGYAFGANIGRLPDDLVHKHIFTDSLPGTVPEPNIITSDQINDYMFSTLVQFENVSFSDNIVGLPWAPPEATATNRLMFDKNNKPIQVRTSSYADFSAELVPSGFGTITGFLSRFGSEIQLILRDLSDVGDFGGTVDPGEINPIDELNEDFSTVMADVDIGFVGWTNFAEAGSRRWQGKIHQGNGYAQATGFQSNLSSMITWLITPPVTMNEEKLLRFKSAQAFWEHNDNTGLTVWASTDYDGVNVLAANWEPITSRIAAQSDPAHAWIESGNIDLSSFMSSEYVFIAFKYRGSGTESTSFRIDDVYIGTEENGGGGGGGGTGSGTQADPYDIAEGIARQGQGVAWIQGYIVGTVKDGINTVSSSADLQFTAPFIRNTHVLLADNASETDYTKIIAVNLPAGSALRTQVNLADNPANLGKILKVNGNLTTYFGIAGLRDSPGTANDFELEDNGGGGGGGGGNSIFLETFTTTLGSFSEYSVTGDQKWRWDTYDGGCAVMSGFVGGSAFANEDWLISPAISLAGQTGVTMSFREAINYITSINDLQVLISVDYSGSGNPNTNGNWAQLSGFNRAPGNSWNFIDSGDVSLAAYEGQTIYIAFKYVCGSSAASTWEVGRVEVKN